MKEKNFDVIVAGGGASGLMAAICAARRGANVAILDHHAVSGKKLLATGNGKCNFTNQMQGGSCYRCSSPAFVLQVLNQFSVSGTLDFFRQIGVLEKDRNGYYYPRSGQASTIRDALLSEAKRLHIAIYNEIGIRTIQEKSGKFLLQTKSGDFSARACILATGGKASPKTGSDGSGYIYARSFGHTVNSPLPALVPLIADETWPKETAGVRCDARVTLMVDHKKVSEDTGEVQLTDYGISGIPVFQVSRYASIALDNNQKVTAFLDFVPEYEEDVLIQILSGFLSVSGKEKTWEEILCGLVNQKIAVMICKKLHLTGEKAICHSSKNVLSRIVRNLKMTELSVVKTKGFEQAQVTCGGISTEEIDPDTMASKLIPGLFFAGEMIDVDGICGGYNLQWAWSSGYVAGIHAADLCLKNEIP